MRKFMLLFVSGALGAAAVGTVLAATASAERETPATRVAATQESAVKIVDRCCFDLDGGGKPDDGFFSVNLGGDVLMALVYEDPDGNKKFEGRDEIKAITLGNEAWAARK